MGQGLRTSDRPKIGQAGYLSNGRSVVRAATGRRKCAPPSATRDRKRAERIALERIGGRYDIFDLEVVYHPLPSPSGRSIA